MADKPDETKNGFGALFNKLKTDQQVSNLGLNPELTPDQTKRIMAGEDPEEVLRSTTSEKDEPTSDIPEEKIETETEEVEIPDVEEPKEIQVPQPPIETKQLSGLINKLSSLFSPKKEIDFDNVDFTLDIFPKNDGKGTTIAYKLKEHETETFDDLMVLLPTEAIADTFKWIITTILNDYETLIQEEISWQQEIKDLTPAEIEAYIDIEKEETRQIRLERLGLFTAPQNTRGKNVNQNVTCNLGFTQMEKFNQLMLVLDTNKVPIACRWIMNAFVDDYGDFIHDKAKDAKLKNSLLGKL